MGVRLFSKRSLRFSHEINHLEVIYADLISQRRGEGYFCKDSPRVRGYTERVKEEKPWWPKSFMGFNQANERAVCRDAGSFALMKSLLSPRLRVSYCANWCCSAFVLHPWTAMDTAGPAHKSTTDISAVRALPPPLSFPFDLSLLTGKKEKWNFLRWICLLNFSENHKNLSIKIINIHRNIGNKQPKRVNSNQKSPLSRKSLRGSTSSLPLREFRESSPFPVLIHTSHEYTN